MVTLTVVEPGQYAWSAPGNLPAGNGKTWGQLAPGKLPPKLMPLEAGIEINVVTQEHVNPFAGLSAELDKEILYQQALVRQNALKYADVPTGDVLHWKTYALVRGQDPYGPEHYCTWFSQGRVYVSEHYHQDGATFDTYEIDFSNDYIPCNNKGDPGHLLISYPAGVDPIFHWIVLDGIYEGSTIQAPYLADSGKNVLAGSVDENGDEHPPVPPLLPAPPALPDEMPPPPPPPFPPLQGEVIYDEPPPPGGEPMVPKYEYKKDPDDKFRLHIERDTTCDCPEFEPSTENLNDPVVLIFQNFFDGPEAPGNVAITQYLIDNEPPGGWGGSMEHQEYQLTRRRRHPVTGDIENHTINYCVPKFGDCDSGPIYQEIAEMLQCLLESKLLPAATTVRDSGYIVQDEGTVS